MSAAQRDRPATLSRVFAWISLVLAVAACSSAGPGDAPDGANVDAAEVDGEDAEASASAAEAACAAQNGECVTATWTNGGTCAIEPRTGQVCGAGASVCAGICSAAGTCVGPGPDVTCGEDSGQCAHCDGTGQCVAFGVGLPCKVDNGDCGQGICQADGHCARASAGQPCTGGSGTCRKPEGTCNAVGKCIGAADAGANCTVGGSPCGDGLCTADAVCVPASAGVPCTTWSNEVCRTPTGVCGANGVCVGGIDVGAPCKASSSSCVGVCNAQGACVGQPAGVGAKCTVDSGPCAGKPGTCSVGGFCLGSGDCTKPPYVAEPSDGVIACVKLPFSCKYEADCAKFIPSMPAANSSTCGAAGDPCRPKFCRTLDSDSTFSCKVGQLNDGTPCPGDATNPCSASTCQAGKCTAAFKPAGSDCKPLVPGICGEFQCSGAGKCESVPASVPLAAPCTISDGDTDCWAKSCDSLGNCTKTPRAKGEHCSTYPNNACANFACNGKGDCLIELKADKGTCADARCSEPNTMPGSPCTGGPCIDSSCTALGKCSTAYKPVGSSCKVSSTVGVCNEDHTCVLPPDDASKVIKTKCWGTFPCMNEDVAYGADGLCHGTVAVGAACGTLCNPGVCGPDGTCQKAFAPKGVVCGATGQCGTQVCDGKGGCTLDGANVGKACQGGEPWDCAKYVCKLDGSCGLVPTPGVACAATSPCTKGVCNAKGFCAQQPLTGPECPLAGSKPCVLGSCKDGACLPAALPGGSCEPDPKCLTFICNGEDPCTSKVKVGASCNSKDQCIKGVCGAFGQCIQVAKPGAKCQGKSECTEGICNSAGQCDAMPKPAGSGCTAVAPNSALDCYAGECDGKTTCKVKAKTGAPCNGGVGPCTTGICQSDASCKTVPANLGKPCVAQCLTGGTCGPDGNCVGEPKVGAACYALCLYNAKCDKQGACVGTVAAGEPCDTIGLQKDGLCTQRICDSNAACILKNLPAGKSCTVGLTESGALSGYPCGSPSGTCNDAGTCKADVVSPDGSACGLDDSCAEAHVCKSGACVPVAPKADQTPCTYGCGAGFCSGGACIAKTTWPMQGTSDYTGSPCDDGIECTYDFCWGSPLAGPGALGWEIPFQPGQCATTKDFSNCPSKKTPANKCTDSLCKSTACGVASDCHYSYDGPAGWCETMNEQPSVVYQVKKMCDDGDVCSVDYCEGGQCHSAVDAAMDGKSCGPFKQCHKGKCVPWN